MKTFYKPDDSDVLCKTDNATLDSNFCYDPPTAYKLFEDLGESGREIYAWTEITIDFIFPVIYGLFFSLLIIYIFRRFDAVKIQMTLAMLPLAAMLFDFCENFTIAWLLFAYPQKYFAAVEAASWFTKIKWFLVGTSAAVILTGLIWSAILFLKKTGKQVS